MPKVKVQVQLTEDALSDFKAIQNHNNYLVSEWGTKYLKGLIELPPKSWLDVRLRWDKGIFKISDFIPFDIRGKVECGSIPQEIVVLITRFTLKKPHSKIWFEKLKVHDIWGEEEELAL